MIIADTVSAPPASHTGTYVAVLLSLAVPAFGWAFKVLIQSLRSLHKEQAVQSSGLAVLVSQVGPVTIAQQGHDQRLRDVETGQARLEGAMQAHQEFVADAVHRLTRRD